MALLETWPPERMVTGRYQPGPAVVAAIVHPHVRGHILTAAGWTRVASVLVGWIARSPPRRGEPWASGPG